MSQTRDTCIQNSATENGSGFIKRRIAFFENVEDINCTKSPRNFKTQTKPKDICGTTKKPKPIAKGNVYKNNATTHHVIPYTKPSTVFKKKSGTTDRGKDYEHLYIASLVLNLIVNDNVEDFYLSSNDEEFGSFDDVVVEIKYVDQNQSVVYAIQLKHSQNKVLRAEHLVAEKGNFSINKYFSEKVADPKVQMVLLTNCTSENLEFIQVTLKDQTVNVELLKTPQNELLKTSDQGDCYQFLSDTYNDFFQNFSLYTNQGSVETLKSRTLNLFGKVFGGHEDIFIKYLAFITKWSMKEGKKNKLDKLFMKEQLFLLLTSSFLKPMVFSLNATIDGKKEIFRDAITKFERVHLDRQNYQIIKTLWEDVVADPDVLSRINQAHKKYLLSLRYIQNREGLEGKDRELSQSLWLLEKCPLILEGCPEVYKAIKVCSAKNIIILKDSENLDLTPTFQNLSDLKSDSEIYEKIIDNFTYSIEGQVESPLKHLLKMNEELEVEITADKLARMLDGPLEIGSQKENLPPCHIERKLTKIVIDIQFVKNLPKNTIVIITEVENSDSFKEEVPNTNIIETNWIYNNDNVVYISVEDISDEDFNNISTRNPAKCIHHFRYLNKTHLEWIKTKNWQNQNYFKKVNKYRLDNEYTGEVLQESAIFGERENNINIICANPGMGKSTLAKSLKNNSSSEIWTVVIYARNHSQHFRKFGTNVDDFMNNILNETVKIERKDLNLFLIRDRIRLIWDGLDEVSEESLKIILSLIEGISNIGIKQWLTSRHNLKNQLESRFNTFSRDLKQFDEQEQKEYIRNRLKLTETELLEIFPKIKSNIELYSNNDILGIPLQIYMVTNLLSQKREKYLMLLEGLFTILDLYEHFVYEQLVIFFEGKRNQNLNNELNLKSFENHQENHIKYYQEIAFHIYLKAWWTKTVIKWLSRFWQFGNDIEEITKKCEEVGLIKAAKNIDDVEFTHNSYGEYFAALYLFNNNPHKAREYAFISHEKFNNIRFFLDLMLTKNSKPVVAILCRNHTLFQKCSEKDLLIVDSIGRDLLELSCAWNKQFSILRLEKCSEFEFKSSLSEKNTTVLNYKDIKKVFDGIDLSRDVSKKQLLLFFPFLIPFYDKMRQDFHPDYLPSVLNYAVKLDNTQLFDLIQNSTALKSSYNKIKRESLLSLVLNCKSRKVLDKIVLDPEYRLLLLTKLRDFLEGLSEQHEEIFKYLIKLPNFDGKLPIHYACAQGVYKSVRWLIDRGSSIDVVDNVGNLPIHYACRIFNFKIVKLLLNHNSKINIPDEKGLLPIHYACEKYEFKVVQLLLNRNSEVNKPDKNGLLPIHYACEKYEFEMVKLLLNYKSEINKVDKNGLLPIHYACEKYNFEVVHLLLEHNSAVNVPDQNGMLPIHYACKVYILFILELLLERGAKTDVPDSHGLLPMHYACMNRNGYEIVKLLLKNHARIDLTDSNGILPIHYACTSEDGFKIVKLLLEMDAKIDVLDANGALPIHYACQNQTINCHCIIELLLENGAEVNLPDANGVLPIHYVCKNEYGYEAVKLLLDKGANLNVLDSDGLTPTRYALINEGDDADKIIQLLTPKMTRKKFFNST